MDKINKFEILAERRMTEIIKKMRILGNLSNRNNYEYTDEHVESIMKSLEEELNILKNKFKSQEDKQIEFKFKK